MIIPVLPPSSGVKSAESDGNLTDNVDSTQHTKPSNIEKPAEWVMVELNGELHLPADLKSVLQAPPPSQNDPDVNKKEENNDIQTNGSVDNGGRKRKVAYLELGSINYDKEGTPVMVIGSHELRGKVEKLKQPFVVMTKKRKHSSHSGSKEMNVKPDEHQKVKQEVEYKIAGVITNRIMFNSYPKSIMR